MESLANILNIANLSIAIMENNMDAAVQLVEVFNGITDIEKFDSFNIFDFINYENETLEYVVNNLTTYPEIDRIRWQLCVSKMIKRYETNLITKEDILDFIRTKLANESIDEYYYGGLIRLATIIHDYDSLIAIRNKIVTITASMAEV